MDAVAREPQPPSAIGLGAPRGGEAETQEASPPPGAPPAPPPLRVAFGWCDVQFA